MTTLYIFDVDGTIADRDSVGIYLHFIAWLKEQRARDVVVALATNQGGAGLRYWMESAGFGRLR
jgi:hydroxymethylpyrimidine pyrophosphatase-like HAD family hydrolase